MVFSLLLSLLRHFLHKSDEVIDAEGTPGAYIKIEIREGLIGRNIFGMRTRMFLFGDEVEAERSDGFADRTVCLIRVYKQRSRDTVIERYGMGVNQFYEMKKRVDWILERT